MEKDKKEQILESLPDALSEHEIDVLLKKLVSLKSPQMNLESWKQQIQEAKETGFFPVDSVAAAENWGTCAVGSRLQIDNPKFARYFDDLYKKRNDVRTPKSFLTEQARTLGGHFYTAVKENNIEKAEMFFNQIQNLPFVLKVDEKSLKTNTKK